MINARKCPDPPVGAQTAPGRGWTLAARRRPEEAQSGACAPPQGRPTRPPPISRGRAHLARVRARARARAAALAPAPAARVVRLLSSVRAAVYQCRFEAPAAHRPCTPAVKRHARARARSHCDRSVSPRHRRSPRGGGLLAAQRHSDDAARVHLEVDSGGRCAAVAGHGLVIRHELASVAASGRIGRC
jgi:hypothetical protein